MDLRGRSFENLKSCIMLWRCVLDWTGSG